MSFQEQQIVRFKEELDGVRIAKDAVGFILKVGNADDVIGGAIDREDRKRIRDYGEVELVSMMAISEFGIIAGAGIFPSSNLEPVEDVEWKDAKAEYDRRFGEVEAASVAFKNQMIAQIAQELEVPPELVRDVVDLYDRKQKQAAGNLR
jgi:hypothetical protein